MLTFQISGNIQRIIDYVKSLTDGLDIMPLAEQFRMIAIEDNMQRSEAGEDKYGVDIASYAPLRKGRFLLPSEIRARGGSGPVLAPRGAGSRIVTAFQVEIARLGTYTDDKSISIKGGWPTAQFMRFHVEGRGFNPLRDVAGITPDGTDKLADATHKFMVQRVGLY